MSDKSVKMTMRDLEGSNSLPQPSKYPPSAFSTALPHKDTANAQTRDASGFEKDIPDIGKHRIAVKLFQKEKKPVFKETNFEMPDLDEPPHYQNENDAGVWNQRREDAKEQENATLCIVWKSATKVQTAEVVRNLFSGRKVDYNFEYRKKKFFETFSKR